MIPFFNLQLRHPVCSLWPLFGLGLPILVFRLPFFVLGLPFGSARPVLTLKPNLACLHDTSTILKPSKVSSSVKR